MLISTIPKEKEIKYSKRNVSFGFKVNNCSHVSDDVLIKEKEKSETGQTIGAVKSMLFLRINLVQRYNPCPGWRKSHLSLDFTYPFFAPTQGSPGGSLNLE